MGAGQSFLESTAPLKVASSPVYGRYLTDNAGRALYIYTHDPANTSACFGDCLVKWPIYAPASQPIANIPDISNSLFGRTTAGNQLTYNRWPLYYYYLDVAAGDTNGQTVDAAWYLVRPDGHPIVTHPASQGAVNNFVDDSPTVASGDRDWKKWIPLASFAGYYRWKKWRKYAEQNNVDWKSHKRYQDWTDKYWHPNVEKIEKAYGEWRTDYNPHHLHSWNIWKDWVEE